jgi:sugar lactone lactonase YvrE
MSDTQSASKRIRSFSVFATVLTLTSASALAQAPSAVADAQQVLGEAFNSPQSIAISSNGTTYVADTGNNQILILTNLLPSVGENSGVIIPSNITPALATPQALAVDANGDLFIADSPAGGGRIIELNGDGAGNLTGTGQVVYAGNILTTPISLAVDSAGTLYIGDTNAPDYTVGAIFTIAAGGTTPTVLNTNLPTTLIPAGLATDAAKDLYIADNNSGNIYKLVPGGTATAVPLGQFAPGGSSPSNGPSGVTLDTAGDLFILTQLGSGSNGQVIEIPAASPGTPFILPSTSLGNSTAFAFDPQGNLDIVLYAGEVVQLAYRTPVNMGNVVPSQTQFSANVLFNFELNTPKTLRGFQVVSQGDPSTELTQAAGGTCTFGSHTTVGGNPITTYNPYTCSETYTGTGIYPGLRYSAIEAEGAGTTVLTSTPVYQTTFLGAQVIYPLTATVTATGLKQPQALALSGLDKTLYIADTVSSGGGGEGFVYSTNGPAGTALTRVNTGRQPLLAPSALAVDGAGNLFIADFDRGDVIEVPPGSPNSATAINTGGLLQHPIALAFDFLGDLYIGDAGPGGVDASSSQPGYIVEIPVGGSAFQLNIPGVSVVFPQALATDPYSANLFIGDGGDPAGVGQVVELSADGTTANIFPANNVTDPTGLGLDAADNLYVLDGNSDTITVVAGAQLGNNPTLLPFDNSGLSSASALAVSAGGQSFVIANIGTGSDNNLLYLNGNLSTLAFGNVNVGSQSQSLTATLNNIGNTDLTLQSPYFTTGGANPAFSVLGSSSCTDGKVLSLYETCSINMQFAPTTGGPASESLFVQSDGYNSGKTTLTATGTGVGGGNFRRPHDIRRERVFQRELEQQHQLEFGHNN